MWDCNENQIELVFIRHGFTKGNEEKRYIGKTDEGLSLNGQNQLLARAYPAVELVFTSPMLRAKQTADLLYPQIECICIQDFSEIDFGRFENKTYLELENDGAYQEWIDSNGSLPFPGGESREAFIARSMRGFEEMLAILCRRKNSVSKVAVVVHGGTIMAIASQTCGGDYYDYQIENGHTFTCTVIFHENGYEIRKGRNRE